MEVIIPIVWGSFVNYINNTYDGVYNTATTRADSGAYSWCNTTTAIPSYDPAILQRIFYGSSTNGSDRELPEYKINDGESVRKDRAAQEKLDKMLMDAIEEIVVRV